MQPNATPFVKLINQLLENRVSANHFQNRYIELWKADVARQRTVSEGRLTHDETGRRIKQGTRPEETLAWEQLAALHSTASSYTTDEALLATGTYVTESQLRKHAQRVLPILRKLAP